MAESSSHQEEVNTPGNNKENTVHVKLVLLGESAVGKSSLSLRFTSDDFKENTEPTIGSAFLTKKIKLGDKSIKFEIWDTAGQERFSSLAPMYYRNAQASIVVYDITKPSSFKKAKHWVHELTHQASANVVIALAGNKCDLAENEASTETTQAEGESEVPDEVVGSEEENEEVQKSGGRQVSFEEASKYAQELGLIHFETSAKTGLNVTEIFKEIAKKIPFESLMSRTTRASGLNSGNGRIDLLREGGGANAFGISRDSENETPFGGNKNGCC